MFHCTLGDHMDKLDFWHPIDFLAFLAYHHFYMLQLTSIVHEFVEELNSCCSFSFLTFRHNEQLLWQWEVDRIGGLLHIHPKIHLSSIMTTATEFHSLILQLHSLSWLDFYHHHHQGLHNCQHYEVDFYQWRKKWNYWN